MKTVVVTGGSKGIGKALCEKFLSEGYSVITCARNPTLLTELNKKWSLEYPKQNVLCEVCDVSDKKQLLQFADKIKQSFNQINVLINNAGVFIPGQIHKEEEGVFEKTMQTNLNSTYYLTRALLPVFLEQKFGHIVNICSTASKTAYVNGGSYCISKFAQYGMTKVLREEMIPYNVRVTAVLPGATLTHSWEGTDLPTDRFIQPTEVAESVWSLVALPQGTNVEEITLRPLQGDI